MPIIPRVPSVSPGALPGVRLSPAAPIEAFGGGIAAQRGAPDLSGALAASDRIANEQQRIRLEEKARADQIAVTDAGRQLSEYQTHALYDPEKGALNQLGKNAFGVPTTLRGEFGDVTNVIRNGLGNDDQKAAFDRMVANTWSVMNEQVQHHVAAQRQRYDNETTAGFVANKQNEALQAWNDPDAVDNAIAFQRAALLDHAKRNGIPDEAAQESIAKATSATRASVVEAMLNNDQDLTAAKYFQEHQADFVGNDLLQTGRQVEAGSLRGESQRRADAIAQTTTTLADGLKAVQSIDDPRLRDAVEERVRRHFADAVSDQRQRSDVARTQLGQLLEQNGGNVDRLKTRPEWLFDLDDTDRSALERRAELIRHPEMHQQSNLSVYTHLTNMAWLNDGTQQQFVNLNLGQYRDQLSYEDYKHFLNLQLSIRRGDFKAEESADRSQHRKDETAVIKAGETAQKKSAEAANLEKLSPGASKYLTPAPRVQVPQWMLDSAKHDPDYRDYLKRHGVAIDDPTTRTANDPGGNVNLAPPTPKVPGAPIQRPVQQSAPARPPIVNLTPIKP